MDKKYGNSRSNKRRSKSGNTTRYNGGNRGGRASEEYETDDRRNKNSYVSDKRDASGRNSQNASANHKGSRNTGGDGMNKRSERAKREMSDYVGSTNDPSWYNRNKRLIEDVSKIPFSNQLGAAYHMDTQAAIKNSGAILSPWSVAGIMAFQMVNTPGIATNSSDGVNIATAGLFQYVRKNLSTVADYAPADIMMYTLGIDDIFSQYANITRIFGIINAYSAINLYYPKALLYAGYGFTDSEINEIIGKLNTYRSRFNNLLNKASTLYLPTDFSITRRHSWLYMNYFTDGQTGKSQIYIHRMMNHLLMDETAYTTGTSLRSVANATTLSGLLDTFNDCIDAYRNSDSMLRIAADMKRAFEEKVVWKLAYIDEGYMAMPLYDLNVLNQIHNLTVYPTDAYNLLMAKGVAKQAGSLDVTQNVDKNTISYDPTVSWATTADTEHISLIRDFVPIVSDQLLNFHIQDVKTDDILEATRNVLVGTCTRYGGTTTYKLRQMGVDMCVGIGVVYYNAAHILSTLQFKAAALNMDLSSTTPFQISFLSQFDWAPKFWINADPYLPETIANLVPMCDLENYTVVSRDLISQMNDNILISMWNVPELGAYEM